MVMLQVDRDVTEGVESGHAQGGLCQHEDPSAHCFGGDPNTVALYVSYLSEGVPYVVNTFHWREGNRVVEFRTTELGDLVYGAHKPVFVLTSPGTFVISPKNFPMASSPAFA